MSLLPANTVVVLTSQYFPPFTFDLSGIGASGPPGRLMTALKPKLTVLVGNTPLYAVAPAGEPSQPNQWPVTRLALIGLAASIAFAIFRKLRG